MIRLGGEEYVPWLHAGQIDIAERALAIDDKLRRTVTPAKLKRHAVGRTDHRGDVREDRQRPSYRHLGVGRHNQELNVAALEVFQPIAQLREIRLSAGSGVGENERHHNDFLVAELAQAIRRTSGVLEGEVGRQLADTGAVHLGKVVVHEGLPPFRFSE